jgi:glucose-1-phosphate thymidylyltransferase
MRNLIGLFPAAGRGSRLGTIPCSKEIMPLGFQTSVTEDSNWYPVTAIERHLHAFSLAQVERVGIIVGSTKWDIVRYLGNGERVNIPIAYFFQEQLYGMPFALDLAYLWVKDATVLFSMPDTLIAPLDAMAKLVAHHESKKADVTLGLFKTETPQKFGMVELDDVGKIVNFIDKPVKTDLTLMWGCAAWSPKFTRFIHQYLAKISIPRREVVLSDLFLAALAAGQVFEPFQIDNGHYHDIGTPESFQTAVYDLARQQRKLT